MKQKWTIFLLVLLAATPAAAASITVMTPAANANLVIGVASPVTWTYQGLPDSTKIKIVLWRNGSNLGVIIQDLGIGQGSYDWKVGTFPVGPGYSVRVRTMDNSVSGFSGSFSLVEKPGDPGTPSQIITLPTKIFPATGHPCMAVTSPKAGDSADPYNTVLVKWNKAAGLDANVSVTLQRTGKGEMLGGVTLAASTPNSGQFNWEPASLNPAPGIYSIKVKTLDGKCEAISGQFTMKELGGIEILTPKGGEVWESGSSHAVTWKRIGNIQNLEIQLSRQGSWMHTLAQGADAKLGSKICTFVRGDTDGANPICYKVFINHSGGSSVNPSGCFILTGNPELAITDVGFSGLINVGYDQIFKVKIENKGTVASQPCQGAMKVNGVSAKTFPVPAIPAGGSVTVPVTWKVSCPGKITIVIDAGGANIEADKANNVWEKNMC